MARMSTVASRRTLIIGCGYVGLATGALLAAAGDAVFGLRRSADGGEALRAGEARGLSNVIERSGATVALADGILIVFEISRGSVS